MVRVQLLRKARKIASSNNKSGIIRWGPMPINRPIAICVTSRAKRRMTKLSQRIEGFMEY